MDVTWERLKIYGGEGEDERERERERDREREGIIQRKTKCRVV